MFFSCVFSLNLINFLIKEKYMHKKFKKEILKNIFSLLIKDQPKILFQRASLQNIVKYYSIEKDELTEIYNLWKEEQGEIYLSNTVEENKHILSFIISALLSDSNIAKASIQALYVLSEKAGVKAVSVRNILTDAASFRQENDIKKRSDAVRSCLEKKNSPESISISDKNSEFENNNDFYIANQISPEGIDEIQRLLIAAKLGINVALDGPPGVGKTRAIIEISRILNKNLYTRTCSSRTTESHIISFPVLSVQEGASVTTHVNGPLASAMEEGCIFYGDEFNLLKEDVQKRLNSAFDERKSIDRNDGIQVKARKGFWAAISYNPSQSLVVRDLEDSVADRFIHFHFKRWDPDFKAFVSLNKASALNPLEQNNSNSHGINLGWRGIHGDTFLAATEVSGSLKWYDYFTGKAFNKKPDYIYRVHDNDSVLGKLTPDKYSGLQSLESKIVAPEKLSRLISRFTDMLHSLSTTGKSNMLSKIGFSNIMKDEDLEILSLHESSTRIEIAALQHYNYLKQMGLNSYLAQTYAVNLIIDQICYGQYRDKKLRDTTAYNLVLDLAKGMRLFSNNTKFKTDIDTILSDK